MTILEHITLILIRLLGLDFDPARDAETPPWVLAAQPAKQPEKAKAIYHHVGGLIFRDVKPVEAQVVSEWVLESASAVGPKHLTDEEAKAVANYRRYKLNVDVARKVKLILCEDDLSVSAKAKKAGMSETVLAHYRSAINSVNTKA